VKSEICSSLTPPWTWIESTQRAFLDASRRSRATAWRPPPRPSIVGFAELVAEAGKLGLLGVTIPGLRGAGLDR
jgi:hypothetical protein